MALFKIFRGKSTDLDKVKKVDGYAYFCTDDGSFWIDYTSGKDEGGNEIIERKKINANALEELKTAVDEIEIPDNYVTTDTNQTINAEKTFTAVHADNYITVNNGSQPGPFGGTFLTDGQLMFSDPENPGTPLARYHGTGITMPSHETITYPEHGGVMATQEWVNENAPAPDLSNYVDLTSNQTMTGVKTFNSQVNVNNGYITLDNQNTAGPQGGAFITPESAMFSDANDGGYTSYGRDGINYRESTDDYTYTLSFPEGGGVIATTDDIPDTSNFVDLSSNQIVNGLKTFNNPVSVNSFITINGDNSSGPFKTSFLDGSELVFSTYEEDKTTYTEYRQGGFDVYSGSYSTKLAFPTDEPDDRVIATREWANDNYVTTDTTDGAIQEINGRKKFNSIVYAPVIDLDTPTGSTSITGGSLYTSTTGVGGVNITASGIDVSSAKGQLNLSYYDIATKEDLNNISLDNLQEIKSDAAPFLLSKVDAEGTRRAYVVLGEEHTNTEGDAEYTASVQAEQVDLQAFVIEEDGTKTVKAGVAVLNDGRVRLKGETFEVNGKEVDLDLNLKNGQASGSIEQILETTEKSPKATGYGAVAFGGFRGDKPDEQPTEDDRTNVASGIQSAVFGCGNLAAGDWDLVGGKDNTVYSNRAIVFGGANVSYQVDADGNCTNQKSNTGRFNAIFGNNNTFTSTQEGTTTESNLIAGGSNTVSGEKNTVAGYNNNVVGSYNNVSGQGNILTDDATRNIVSGWKNITNGIANNVSGELNTINGSYNLTSGKGNVIHGDNNTSTGFNCAVYGDSSHAEGYSRVGAEGAPVNYAHSQNYDTEANGFASTAAGIGTKTGSNGQFVIGSYNENKSYSVFEIGGGTSADDRKNWLEVDRNTGRLYNYLTDEGKASKWHGDILVRSEIEEYVQQYVKDNFATLLAEYLAQDDNAIKSLIEETILGGKW